MDRLLIATNNKGKLREYQSLLKGVPWTLVSLSDCGIVDQVAENGLTFEENAALKATGYARLSGLPTLADDSGLEVDALGGEPGVHSARFGGDISDSARIQLLLSKLARVPAAKRTARFRCVIAFAPGSQDGDVVLCKGSCEGTIGFEPRGANGFGYDPIFVVPDTGMTMAELGEEEKNRISHRARAAARCRPVLESMASGARNK